MADWTPFGLFCDENYPLMRQLKPFRFFDDAAQKKILESAWTKLGGKNKQYYINEAAKQPINANTRYTALKNMKEADSSEDDDDYAFEIYRTEIRLILLQDPAFVKDHYHELKAVIKEGWIGLSEEQRLDFYERAVLATEDGYTGNSQKKQTSVIRGKFFGEGPKHLDLKYMNGAQGFHQTRSTEWTSHDYKILTNPIDTAAFEEFANVMHAEKPSLVGKTIWNKWMNLKPKERESYYLKAFQTAASIDADTLFLLEKQRSTQSDRTNFMHNYTEKHELEQAWNDISEEVRKIYIDKALNYYLERDQNPKTRFLGIYDYNKDKFMARATTIDDVNAELTPRLPLSFVHKDNEKNAFLVYMEKTRPQLLKQPGMVQKRFWEVNLVLWKQWCALSEGEQQPYYDTVRRYLQIRRKLKGWQLEAWKILGEDYKHRRAFFALDAEAKAKHAEVAMHNRKILLKKFPDLHEYYFWILPERTRYDLEYASSSSKSSLVDTVKNKAKGDSEELNNAYSPKYDYLMYTDVSDINAFEEYENDVEAMASKYITTNVWWRQFVNLTDEERNVYYDRAIETEAAKQSRILFAEDNCTVTKKSKKDQAYADEMPRLNEAWKNLSAPAKKYYVDLAKKELLKREKHKPEDHYFTNNAVYFSDIEVDNIHCDGHLVPKYSHVMHDFAKPEKNALTVYLKKHFTELYNEPGMADKRYFQLCLVLEQRFMNLSDEERQTYLDIVQVINNINGEIRNLPVTTKGVYYQKHKTLEHWQTANDEEKAVWQEEAKQNLKTLMEKFPALTEHFHWMVYRETSTESKATATNAKTAATEEPAVTNETTEDTSKEASGTWEVVNDNKAQKEASAPDAEITSPVVPETDNSSKTLSDKPTVGDYASEESDSSSASWEVVKDKTIPQEVEEGKFEKLDSELSGNVETLANTVEPTIDAKMDKQEATSVKAASALQEPAVDGNTSEDSESSTTWEVIKDEQSTPEEAASKTANTDAVEVAVHEDKSESSELAETLNLRKQLGIETSPELLEFILNATTAEKLSSAATCEVVDNEKKTGEDEPEPSNSVDTAAVPENAQESSANSTQAKKTPTAFMFYKKAMRRLNADQNFGKKDNVSQRQALISDWKKLSNEDKAVYFEKERLARLQLEKQ
uniref:HMG box domain-containing protein n=1 Tax=Panagrellus redivivus TaxID=6233 RepID=A0A7E4W412_PANRE